MLYLYPYLSCTHRHPLDDQVYNTSPDDSKGDVRQSGKNFRMPGFEDKFSDGQLPKSHINYQMKNKRYKKQKINKLKQQHKIK